MSARRPRESDAGPWVAYLNDGRVSYVRGDDGEAHVTDWTSDLADAMRYSTKREALAAVRRRRRRQPYVSTGAHRVEPSATPGGGS